MTNIEQGMSNNEVQRINKFSGHPWGGSQPPSSPLCGDVMTIRNISVFLNVDR